MLVDYDSQTKCNGAERSKRRAEEAGIMRRMTLRVALVSLHRMYHHSRYEFRFMESRYNVVVQTLGCL